MCYCQALFVYTFYDQLATYTIYLVQIITEFLYLADDLSRAKNVGEKLVLFFTFILVF